MSARANITNSTGNDLTYTWSNDCTDGVQSSFPDVNDLSKINLSFDEPGKGKSLLCTLSLIISQNDCTPIVSTFPGGGGSASLMSASLMNGTSPSPDSTDSVTCIHTAQCATDIQIPPCQIDCNGMINGPAVLDRCNVCNGDGTSCLDCNSVDITSSLFTLDGSAFTQKGLVRKLVSIFQKAGGGKAAAKAFLTQADKDYTEAWRFTWSIPQINVQCTNKQFCTDIDNSPMLASYTRSITDLKNLQTKIANVILKKTKNKATQKQVKSLVKSMNSVFSKGAAEIASVPTISSTCSPANS